MDIADCLKLPKCCVIWVSGEKCPEYVHVSCKKSGINRKQALKYDGKRYTRI